MERKDQSALINVFVKVFDITEAKGEVNDKSNKAASFKTFRL